VFIWVWVSGCFLFFVYTLNNIKKYTQGDNDSVCLVSFADGWGGGGNGGLMYLTVLLGQTHKFPLSKPPRQLEARQGNNARGGYFGGSLGKKCKNRFISIEKDNITKHIQCQ